MNKQRGITLIALVITIIVLLILAGISIAMLTGENGILAKAIKASDEYKKEAAREKIQLAILVYQADKENTTVYDELIKIEGLTVITPNDRNEGPPFTVVVDGYEFKVKEDLNIEFVQEKEDSNLDVPEITEVSYPTEEVEELTLTITAKTEDEAGLEKIEVNIKKTEEQKIEYELIKRETVSGKEAQVQIKIPSNGEYVICAFGKNDKIGKKEITINNIKEGTVLATLSVGNLLENNQPNANIIINAEAENTAIKKIELYLGEEKVQTYDYSSDVKKQTEETYKVNNMEFYKDLEFYAKVFPTNQKTATDTEKIAISNNKIIATVTDLKKLAIQVNNENNTFLGKTLYLINDIAVGGDWIPIGYWDGTSNWAGKYFAGNLEGGSKERKHSITISSLKKDTTYKSNGLFGMIIGGNIRNLTVNGTLDANCDYIGGITGTIKNGTIENCTNNSSITDTNSIRHGGIAGYAEENSKIENCSNSGTIWGKTSVGGIVGIKNIYSNNGKTVLKCSNSGSIKCFGTESMMVATGDNRDYGVVGGICGYLRGESNFVAISECTNTGEVTGDSKIFPKGITAGGIIGWINKSKISLSKNNGTIHYDNSSGQTDNGGALGGIVGAAYNGTVEQCFNEGTITSKYSNNYGMNDIGGIVGYQISSTVKNTYNLGKIYGYSNVGGIVGFSSTKTGFTESNYIYNSFNASETIEGQTNVGNHIGYATSSIGKYNSSISGKTAIGWGQNNNFTEYKAFTLQEMKGTNLLTLLTKEEGNGVWAQSSGSLPYLNQNSSNF